MDPPTATLPGIKKIPSTPHGELRIAIDWVREIYNPPVRGARRRRKARMLRTDFSTTSTSSEAGKACINEDHKESLAELRSDTFERSYVLRWLTSLVAHLTALSQQDEDEEESAISAAEEGQPEITGLIGNSDTDMLLADAAALLAVCAGTASAGVISRVFTAPISIPPTYPSLAISSSMVSVNLRDVPLDNQDYGSVGAQTWGGACVMAEMVAEEPVRFGLLPSHLAPPEPMEEATPFRILELGAGTGLVSLAIASFYRSLLVSESDAWGRRDVEIVATDYYPSVLENLEVNLRNNGFSSSQSETSSPKVSLRSVPLDWSDFPTSSSELLEEPFDMAFGADIVYEEQHAIWIKGCLRKLLSKPPASPPRSTSSPSPVSPAFFHLIIPLRSTHSYESGTIETVFGRADGRKGGDGELDLVILEKETIVCDVEGGVEGEEVVYAYYKIGWQ